MTGKTVICLSISALSATAVVTRVRLVSTSAEGASGFCQTMSPSDRQLMSIGASEHRTFVRAKARFAGPKAQEHSFVRRNAVTPDISLAAFSPISVMTSWPTWAAMAGGHNRRGPTLGVGHARRSWNAVRGDYPRPSLTGNAAHALPFPKSQRPTCPFSFAPGGTPPAPYGPPRHPPLPGVSRFR